MEDTVGIDISKDKLDAYRLSKRKHKQVCNNASPMLNLQAVCIPAAPESTRPGMLTGTGEERSRRVLTTTQQ